MAVSFFVAPPLYVRLPRLICLTTVIAALQWQG
jgi:hypothetical protein